ncbi:Non-functional pseudokinase ZED1 [Vitis vinifera]|uniref:Non-functional pseudokinase ZED1 n=1 Tax=Vitis vinifera TaxID=29760 RepID=A0A438HES2_VITVI|nr:Non-functional pseudokinase ZED1 [Vitis vinifera]
MGKIRRKEMKKESMLKNGSLLLKERISYFNGKYFNPIRSFCMKELQNATDDYNTGLISTMMWVIAYGTKVLWKVEQSLLGPTFMKVLKWLSMKLLLASQMSAHKNALKLLGCCLETRIPILVYEFPIWSIIHTDIKPSSFFLDQDCAAKLSDFSLSITLPEGEMHVEDEIRGTFGYLAPETLISAQPRGIHEELQFQAIFDLAMRCSMKRYGRETNHSECCKEVRRIQKFVP